MSQIIKEPSRTFSEYLLIPGYSSTKCVSDNVSLKTPLTKFKKGEAPEIELNTPLTSAIMQSVSNDTMAIALARQGGISFIYGAQSVQEQASMIRNVKNFKAGFVTSDSNIMPHQTIEDVIKLYNKSGHSTMPVTEDGKHGGRLLGVVTSRDYRISRMDLKTKVSEFMTPFDDLIYGKKGISLSQANDIIWEHKLNALPIIDDERKLCYIVFRKDYDSHKQNPYELLDASKRYMVGAGVNTRDYKERIPALVEAGVDVLCIDSSEGYTQWQEETIKFVKKQYGGRVKIGAGNVVDKEGFRYLAKCGADFIKVGIGGGSICITRETKGIGRGQATSVIEVANERNEYFKETGEYIPICSDGGIVQDYHITLALAMGADFVMLGRYFARFDESPSHKVNISGNYMKEYWGEGSSRARNWQRYDLGGKEKLSFEEGVDCYVPYAGSLQSNVNQTLLKVKSTMCNCGALTISQLQKTAKLTIVSSTSIREGGAHDVIQKNNDIKEIK